MSTTLKKTTRLLAIAAAILAVQPAGAALLDHGPGDPTFVFPLWYRDLNNVALGECLSQAPSPNPAAGLKPMCFPQGPVAGGFAGNIGPEIFYNALTVKVGKGTSFSMTYTASLEASYIPAGFPAHGTELVFSRIRVLASTAVPGTYTVTHPFGIEVFPNVGTGSRAIFFTADVPVGPALDFNAALNGRIGPWIQWDVVNLGESLSAGGNTFLGDPNYVHSYTGSPFGTNFVRVDGPVGSNLDGAGNDFIVEPLGAVMGQIWAAPIATAFNVDKAVYSRNATNNIIDVWATSAPAQQMALTGTGMPSVLMQEFPGGNYYAHVVESAAVAPPASITVTNLTSNPVVSLQKQVVDQPDGAAAYASATRGFSVTATTTDKSNPTLTVVAPWGGLMTTPAALGGTYTFSGLLPAGAEVPEQVRIESNAGGVYLANVVTDAAAPLNAAGLPVANSFVATPAGSGTSFINLVPNVTVAGAFTAIALTQPTTGTVVAAPNGFNFTANPGASGLDSFTYLVQDAIGLSNVATISFNLAFVAPGPTTVDDNFAMLKNTSRTYAVLANDVAGTGTTINPASVRIATLPAHGTATANLDGTVTYTPALNFNSALDTFTYTVANTAGVVSAPATVTVEVFNGAESVSFSKINYTVSKGRWTIVGSTNWFNAALTQTTASCWTGTAAAPTAATLIGTAPVDIFGKFQLVPVGTTPTPVNPSAITCQTSNGGKASGGVVFN